MILGYTVALALLAPTSDTGVIDLLRRERVVPVDLYYLAQKPSGIMFCDSRLGRRQAERFDKRYGFRLKNVIAAETAKNGLGWKPDEIVVLPCYQTTRRDADEMLEAFDLDLRKFEERHGLGSFDR